MTHALIDLTSRQTLYICYQSKKNKKMMKTEHYTPQPVDTKDVVLPEDLMSLAEEMAKNVHEIWAETRIAQGWTYGPERNDAEKKHPCLVPYDELPEEEKVYDRNTSLETLKFIVGNGYEIKKRN